MSAFNRKICYEPNKAIKLGLFLGVALLLFVFFVNSAWADIFEGFETYDVGNLSGQGDWEGNVSPYAAQVSDILPLYGIRHAKIPHSTLQSPKYVWRVFEEVERGSFIVWVYFPTERETWKHSDIRIDNTETQALARWNFKGGEEVEVYHLIYPSPLLCSLTLQEWHKLEIQWEENTQTIKWFCDEELADELESPVYFPFFNKIQLQSDWGTLDVYADDIEINESLELKVWGVLPESESTITDITDDFIFEWQGWDFEGAYKDIALSFWEKNTGIVFGNIIFEPPTENGTSTLQFYDFNFEKNGTYYFHARARSYLYEWSYFYSPDLVSPEYWIKIDIEGWIPIFEMPSFETWYSEHSTRFATPTEIFASITSILSPVFSKIGEFGELISASLDPNEAYQRGYELGIAIPQFKQYVAVVEVFMGGFPIIEVFLMTLLIYLAIFVIRFLFKTLGKG